MITLNHKIIFPAELTIRQPSITRQGDWLLQVTAISFQPIRSLGMNIENFLRKVNYFINLFYYRTNKVKEYHF